jgi:hypothetical protein
MPQRNAPPRLTPRYRVICYELVGERQELLIDSTDQGFVLATGAIVNGVMEGELAHAGPRDLQAHLALMIGNDEQLHGQHQAQHKRPR